MGGHGGVMLSLAIAFCRVGSRVGKLTLAVNATRETICLLQLLALILPAAGQPCLAADDAPNVTSDSVGNFYFGPLVSNDAEPADAFAPPTVGSPFAAESSPSRGRNGAAASRFADPLSGGQADSIEDIEHNRLIDKVTDPTSYLMDLRYRHQWNWPDVGEDSQALQIRPTIPFRAWGQVNVMRVSVPYNIEGNGAPGLGDVQVLDLVVYQQSWGRWGVGPSLQLTPPSTSVAGEFQAGPAAGAVRKNKHWSVGILTQNFFAEDAGQSRIQPILSYKFNDSWAVGIGESEFRYNWEDSTWTQLPLGVELDHIANLHGQKMQFFINPQYNFQQDASNSDWTVFLGLTLLLPEKI
jgi:hypothetical protein